jgi:hypothetical protein
VLLCSSATAALRSNTVQTINWADQGDEGAREGTEHGDTSLLSLNTASRRHPEPYKSIPHTHTLTNFYFNIILPPTRDCTSRLPHAALLSHNHTADCNIHCLNEACRLAQLTAEKIQYCGPPSFPLACLCEPPQ